MTQTVYRNAELIPIAQEGVLSGHDLSVENGIITHIDPTGGEIPADASVVDCTGKYLLPGLIDAHMHITPETVHNDFKLLVAFGATSVRNMWGNQAYMIDQEIDTFDLKCHIEGGQVFGPALVNMSRILDGPRTMQPSSRSVKTKAAAKLMVEQAVRDGAEQVKVYTFLQPEILREVHRQATHHGLVIAGHKPIDCEGAEFFTLVHSVEHTVTFENEDLDALIASNCHFIPTIAIERQVDVLVGRDTSGFFDRYAWSEKYMDPSRVEMLKSAKAFAAADPEGYEKLFDPIQFDYPTAREKVRRFLAESERLPATGSDNNPLACFGLSVHADMACLVDCGLTEAQTLEAATLQASRVLQVEDRKGSLEVCKEADLVILNANPLDDIHNTTEIDGVVLRGQYLDRAALDDLLDEVEKANTKKREQMEAEGKGKVDIKEYFVES